MRRRTDEIAGRVLDGLLEVEVPPVVGERKRTNSSTILRIVFCGHCISAIVTDIVLTQIS